MIARVYFIVIVAISTNSCGIKDHSNSDKISGAYVREYSFKVTNPETGNEIGMRTIRDTIFIHPVGKIFEVSNHKWKLNSHDRVGWQDMRHDEDRPMTTFKSNISDSGVQLTPAQPNAGKTLYLDTNRQVLFKNPEHENGYLKN